MGLYTTYFLDENNGWAAGEDGTILKTTDAGDTWISQSISTPDNIRSILFTDSLNGWIALYDWTPFRHGSVYHSTDGGNTWFSQLTTFDYALLSLFFTDNLNGWVVGTNGIAFKTSNGGNTWQPMSIETYGGWLYSVRFTNSSTGWTVGEMFGQVARTTDGGISWLNQNIPTFYYLVDVYFLDDNYGWGVGNHGAIVSTSDGGAAWFSRASTVTSELRDVQFVNGNEGWIAGFGGVILNSNDGGVSWNAQNSSTTEDLYALAFVNELTGWAVGDNGLILKSVNGGIPVELISFSGIVEGNKIVLRWETATETNNRGFEVQRNNEEVSFIQGSGTTTEKKGYSFVDENINAGTYIYSLIQIDYDGTRNNLGKVEIQFDNFISNYFLNQNFPNPFNPDTRIKYSVPYTSDVSIIIYDMLGRELRTLVNEQKLPGNYEVQFDGTGLSSGAYYYVMRSSNFINTKKLILLK